MSLFIPNDRDYDRISYFAGLLGLFATLIAIIGNLAILFFLGDPGFFKTTISDMAAGPHDWILDYSLYVLCVAILAIAGVLYRNEEYKWDWKIGCFLLGGVSVLIFFIGYYEQYGDGDPGGVVIHSTLVRALWIAFGAVALLMTRGLGQIRKNWGRLSAGFGIAWLISAPIFMIIPTSWDGLYERFVGMLILAWIVLISIYLMKSGGRRN